MRFEGYLSTALLAYSVLLLGENDHQHLALVPSNTSLVDRSTPRRAAAEAGKTKAPSLMQVTGALAVSICRGDDALLRALVVEVDRTLPVPYVVVRDEIGPLGADQAIRVLINGLAEQHRWWIWVPNPFHHDLVAVFLIWLSDDVDGDHFVTGTFSVPPAGTG